MYTAKGQLDRDNLIRQYQPLVRKLAHHMMAKLPASVQVDDLIQVGLIGLSEALSRYEVAQGVQFETFATQRIRGAMIDELRENDWMSRGSRKSQKDIEQALRRLEHQLGRSPLESEIARELGMSLADYQTLLGKVRGTQLVYLEDMTRGGETTLARAAGLPRAAFGAALAHAGLGVTVIGLAATAWGVERIVNVRLNENVEAGPYQVSFEGVVNRKGENYAETYARTLIRRGGVVVAEIEPSKRFYPARKMQTTKAGIETLNFGQIYVSIGDQNPDGSLAVRVYWKPLVTLIWLGGLIMALGGALSLSDRRLRAGAPARARPAPPATMPVAAE